MKDESDVKRTCNIIKEVISKSKVRSPFPNKTVVDIEMKYNSLIAEKFINFFADIDPKLTSKINQLIDIYDISMLLHLYLKKSNH